MGIIESTIAWNRPNTEIYTFSPIGGLTTLTNSVVNGRCTGGPDQYETEGGNVYCDPTHCAVGPDDLIAGREVHLFSLGMYGGPTPTILPYPHSPVIDSLAANGSCTVADQRDILRPQDGDDDQTAHCDSGALEFVFGEMLFGDGFESHGTGWWSSSLL